MTAVAASMEIVLGGNVDSKSGDEEATTGAVAVETVTVAMVG